MTILNFVLELGLIKNWYSQIDIANLYENEDNS